MKIKKISMILTGLVMSLTLLIGCSTMNTESKKVESNKKQNHLYKKSEVANVDGLDITFDKVQMLQSEDKKSDVVHLHFTLENTSAEKKGFSAIELEVKNSDNQKLEVYPGENYGKDLSGGQSDSGSGYFTSKGSGPYSVTYTDATTNKTINWKLNLDK